MPSVAFVAELGGAHARLKTGSRLRRTSGVVAKKLTPLDRLLGRLDHLDSAGLTTLVQRLARERGLLEAVLNTVQEGVLVIADNGTIEYGNAAAARLLGLAEGALAGAQLWRVFPGLRQTLEATLQRSGPRPEVVTRELEVNYPQRRFLRLHFVPFDRDAAADGPRRFTAIVADTTQETLSTEERIESEKVNSILLLAAGVAHELGNPLNSLTIHLQLLGRKLKKLRSLDDGESARESLRICQEEVDRLDGIITNFLEAIRPRTPDFSDVNPAEVLEEVLRFQASELENRGIKVDVQLPAEPQVILADRNQLKQVFFNIVKNAGEAMQPGGALRVRSRRDDESVFLLFGDTGSGIPQEEIAKLFQPYHTTKKDGHGLGMMIIHRIMRDHGGQIGIDSREGVGTVVTLQFPLKHKRVRMLEH
jgi:PAS domain S-box-containing protein